MSGVATSAEGPLTMLASDAVGVSPFFGAVHHCDVTFQ